MWFTENPWPPIILVGCIAVGLLVRWSTNPRTRHLAGVVACLVLAIGIYFLEDFIVTDRERLTDRLLEMTSAFQRNDAETTLEAISTFALKERLLATWALETVDVDDDLRITDIAVKMRAEGTQATTHFRANGTVRVMNTRSYQPSRWNLTWQKEGGEWKIVEIERLHVVNGSTMPIREMRP